MIKIAKMIPKPTPRVANIISSLIYVLLNGLLVAMIVVAVDLFDSPWVGLALVAVSKWRIFSVKIRFWWANLTSNLIDILVGGSFVLLIYYIGSDQLLYQVALAMLYLGWLLLIKPGTSSAQIMNQSLIAIFLVNLNLSIFGYHWPVWLFLMAEMLAAYNIMSHYLKNADFEIKYTRLMSGIWALIMMELAWIYWHWMIGYIFVANLQISQFAIVSTALTFLTYKVLFFMNHDIYQNRRNLQIDLLASVIFVVSLILVMLLFFSKPLNNLL